MRDNPNLTIEYLLANIRNYSDVCRVLGITELNIDDFYFIPEHKRASIFATHQLTNIVELFNLGWKPNFENHNEYKYLPYFQKQSGGWVFIGSYLFRDGSDCSAGLYYKERHISDHCVRLFIDIYINYLN